MIFRASPDADPRFPTTGLDIYCGQAAAPRGTNLDVYQGLPRRLQKYEEQRYADHVKLETQRQTSGDRASTLHVYLLCSQPTIQFESRVVALTPLSDQCVDISTRESLLYDLTIMETTMMILLGTLMSPQGRGIWLSYKMDEPCGPVGPKCSSSHSWSTLSSWIWGK